jgi:hypothetical protein
MTPRRRTSSGSSSGSTRPDTTGPDTPTRPLGGGGDATTVNLNALDTMTTRLDATGGKVDAVGTTIGNVNVGPQSMGIVGGNFTGAAQSHLKTARDHVTRTRKAVDDARAGTTATATTYRQREEINKVNLEKSYGDTTTVPNTANAATRPNTAATVPAATRANTPPTVAAATRPDTAPTVPAGTKPYTAPPPTRPNTDPAGSASPPPSIADRLNPPDPAPAGGTRGHPQSTAERDLQNSRITNLSPIGNGGNVNEAFKAELDDGSHGVYKPESGEQTAGMRQDITGDLGRREVAASRVDEMLGFGRVPTTAWTDGVPPHGPGSLQRFAEGAGPSLDANQYPRQQQQQMAVLDYVTGNTDRHVDNYMTGRDGNPVAIDNGYSFPDGERDAIRSDFVRDHLNQPLDPDVVDAVRGVDPNVMRQTLQDSGLSPTAVDLAVSRLEEIQRRGMITGENWRGPIVDAWWNPVRGPLP